MATEPLARALIEASLIAPSPTHGPRPRRYGFIAFDLPRSDGGTVDVGAIALVCHQEAVSASDFIAFVPAGSSIVRGADGPAIDTIAVNVGAPGSGQTVTGGNLQ